MRAVALLVLQSLCAAATAYSQPQHTHRLAKRSAADTAAAVVGGLLFFLFVGFCWIMCQHPQWNPCGECQCCCCCCCPQPGGRPHPVVAFLRLGPAHWLYASSRGRWGTKAERPPDLEMQALGDDFKEAPARAPSYEARSMRVPSPSSRRSSPTPPPIARVHRDRAQPRRGLQVPERTARSHSRTRSEAPAPREPLHERTTSDPTDRAFADIFGEGVPRPVPPAPPPSQGRDKAIDRWRKTVAGE